MRTAISYLRYSSGVQAKGDSTRRQDEGAEKLCKRHGWRLDDTLSFADLGKSAWAGGKQKELGAFLDACRQGLIPDDAILIVENLDRVSRLPLREAVTLFLDILKAGVSIATFAPEVIYEAADKNSIVQLFLAIPEFSRANSESEIKSERLKQKWKARRKAGQDKGQAFTAMCPQWLRRVGDKFELIEERAEIVRRIFALSIDGYGINKIAQRLNADKVPSFGFLTKDGTQRKQSVGYWQGAYINRILESRAVIGEATFRSVNRNNGKRQYQHAETIPGYYPAVIEDNIFYLAKDAKSKRRGRKVADKGNHINLFSGLITDAVTGWPMMINQTTRGGNSIRRLATSVKAGEFGVKSISWLYNEIEEAFLNHVKELKEERVKPTDKQKNPVPGLEAKLAGVLQNIQDCQEAIEAGGRMKDLQPILNRLWTQRDETEEALAKARLAQAQADAKPLQKARALAAMVDEAPNRLDILTKIKALLPEFIDHIYFFAGAAADNPMHRACLLQIYYKSGIIREIVIHKRHKQPLQVLSAALPAKNIQFLAKQATGVAGDILDLRNFKELDEETRQQITDGLILFAELRE